MARDRSAADRAAVPWWAEGGSEVCPFCHQSYVYELEVRCVDCDSPMCPVCAATERLTVVRHVCPDCVDVGEGAAGDGGR